MYYFAKVYLIKIRIKVLICMLKVMAYLFLLYLTHAVIFDSMTDVPFQDGRHAACTVIVWNCRSISFRCVFLNIEL